jgi:Sulfotransferase family
LSVHFVYHLPKCAGRTIDRHLATALSREEFCRVDRRHGWRRLKPPHPTASEMNRARRVKVVGGHFLGPWVEPFFPDRKRKRSVLLRDPVSQLVSHYNFRMMRYLAQGLHPYSFELAYRARQRNLITHYILMNFLGLSWARMARLSDQEKYEVANAFLSQFWYVGDYLDCDDLIAALADTLGIPSHAPPQNTRTEWQNRVKWRSLEVEDLSSDTIAQIRKENLIDQRLWESWHVARQDTASVHPLPLGPPSSSGFLRSEGSRFVGQVMRRIQRRWGLFKSLRASESQGSLASGLPAFDP